MNWTIFLFLFLSGVISLSQGQNAIPEHIETCTNNLQCIYFPDAFDSDEDEPQGSGALYIPEANRGVCINGTCSCTNPGHIFYKIESIETYACIPKLVDTGMRCGDRLDCDSYETCVTDFSRKIRFCGKCSMGRYSDRTEECVGPFDWDVCRMALSTNDSTSSRSISLSSGPCQIPGQFCSLESSRCTCPKGHEYDRDSRACVKSPSKLHLPCNQSKDCNDDVMKCSDQGICDCKGSYNNKTDTCSHYFNDPCTNHSQCPTNSLCIDLLCSCPHFLKSKDLGCETPLYGKECVSNPGEKVLQALTEQKLTCINGAYRCQVPTEEYFTAGPNGEWKVNQWGHICLIKVGGSCILTPGIGDRCTEGAACVNVTGHLECQCRQGYSATPENKCLKHVEFGAPCTKDKACNNYAGMVCSNVVCGCPDSKMRYDPLIKKCFSPEGHFCGELDLGTKVLIECDTGLKCDRLKSSHKDRECVKMNST